VLSAACLVLPGAAWCCLVLSGAVLCCVGVRTFFCARGRPPAGGGRPWHPQRAWRGRSRESRLVARKPKCCCYGGTGCSCTWLGARGPPRGRGPRGPGDRGSEGLRAEGRGGQGRGRGFAHAGRGAEGRGTEGGKGCEGPRHRGAEGPRTQVTHPETRSLLPPQRQRAQPRNSYQWSVTPGTPTTGIRSAECGGMAPRLEMKKWR